MSTVQPFTDSPRRSSPVQANLTAQEREILRSLAARAGVSQSAYLRRLIAGQLRADAVEAERTAA